MQFVLKHRVQSLQWYITLVVSFASYPCNASKTHVGCQKYQSDTYSIVRYVKSNTKILSSQLQHPGGNGTALSPTKIAEF